MSTSDLDRTIFFTLNGLWTRLGLDSECSFREGLIKILKETGYEVSHFQVKDPDGFVFGKPSDIEIDLIIIGNRAFFVELKASVGKIDLFILLKKADFYSRKTGKMINKLVIITPHIDDDAKQFAEEHQIDICDTLTEISEWIKNG